uniref:Ribosomal RNA small subunit methyltransferase E n=1 Tax=Roseihalotalea indica TaxID=2867963 RepID=A0AA49GMH9_9BACT|nr:16S rRNA (uracil(1498)-N(3))-methyltransferase [Tunicatimonas sp. TK19036]
MPIFYQPHVRHGDFYLDEEEARHCAKVLRKRPGDAITVVDGLGTFYEAIVLDSHPKKCSFEVKSEYKEPEPTFAIHLIIAPTKNTDRMEWMVEKITEIGVNSIQFVECQHSERNILKLDRLQRKAISAMKQSERAFLPQLNPMIPLASWKSEATRPSQQFIAYLSEKPPPELFQVAKPSHDYFVLIGPEGDFSEEEISWATSEGFQPVSLGKNRLRTETAGLVACHTFHLANTR